MRHAVGLVVVLLVACSTPAPAPAPLDTSGGERTSNNHAAETHEGPIVPRMPDEGFAGLWSLTHGGMPWMELEISLHPGLSARILSFDPNGSWTEFTIVRVKLGDSGALEIRGQYTEYPQTVDIALTVSGGELVGTAGGDTYGTPEPVTGRRIVGSP